MEQRYVLLENVQKVFDTRSGRFVALRDVNLVIRQGEFVSIIGHSGCGKSTLLNIVAGLLPATSGGVLLEDREVNEPGPDRAVVFQNHSLLPWLTVYDNVPLANGGDSAPPENTRLARFALVLRGTLTVSVADAAGPEPG